MNTKQWIPVLVAFLMAFGSVQAFADSGWRYDDGSDTINFSYSGVSVIQASLRLEDEGVEQTRTWNYDEGSDNIVFNVEESRNKHARTNPSIDTFESDANYAFLDQ